MNKPVFQGDFLPRFWSILFISISLSIFGFSLLRAQLGSDSSPQSESGAISQLRLALQTTYPNLTERDRALKQCLTALRSVDDLQAAATLVDWRTDAEDEAAGVDRANRAIVIDRLTQSIRQGLRQKDPVNATKMMEILGQSAARARAASEPLTWLHDFAGDLADLAMKGPPGLRGLAARTLAEIEPPVSVAVPVWTALLQSDDAELRRAAADSFSQLLHYSLNAADESSPLSRPASRGDFVRISSTMLPALQRGLADARPEVRRRCLETVGFICTSLTQFMGEPLGADDSAARPPLKVEYEELRPLLTALHNLGPILERLLQNGDPETRISTHKVLEDLGVARDRWLHRCAARQEGTEEKLLSALLHEALPELAQELAHPDVRVRRSAVDVLESSGPLALPALPALARALRDPDRFVRWSAVRTVGKLGPSAAPQTIADLERLLRDPDEDLRKAAGQALERLRSH